MSITLLVRPSVQLADVNRSVRGAAAAPGFLIPPDQVMRNVTTTYESALTAQSLLARGTPEDLEGVDALAEFGDGRGVVAATLESGDTLPPIEQCLSTPFQCIPQRVGLAATTWAVLAEIDLNPFRRRRIVLGDGFSVTEGGRFRAVIDPSLP